MDTRSLTPVRGAGGQAGVGRGSVGRERTAWAHGGGTGGGTGEAPGAAGKGRSPRPRRRRKGRAGGGGCARPLPGVRGSAPPSAIRHRSPEPAARAPAGGVPREPVRPQDPLREAGPGHAGRPGGRRASERLPGPPPTGPAPLSSAPTGFRAGPLLMPQTRHIAGPARWVPGPGLGRKGSESTACVPISQQPPPRPARDRSLRTREGMGRAGRQLGCAPFPGCPGPGTASPPPRRGARGPGGLPQDRGRRTAHRAPARGAARRLGAFPPPGPPTRFRGSRAGTRPRVQAQQV